MAKSLKTYRFFYRFMEKHTNYYEGVLQLRNPKKSIIKKIRSLVSKRKDVFIAEEKKVRGGIDFYISDQRFLQSMGRRLQKEFGGELKSSKKLFGVKRQTSKLIYRVFILVRIPEFEKGQVIDYKGKKVKVIMMDKKVHVKDINSGKKMILNYKDL